MDYVSSITSKNSKTGQSTEYNIKDKEAREKKLNITDLPHKISFFENDTGFITRAVSNLLNYYNKSETYTKREVNELLSSKLTFKIVETLPSEEISTSIIYMVPRSVGQQSNDYYDEYIYNGSWELIGNTYVDLSDYYTKAQADDEIDTKIAVETSARENMGQTLEGLIQDESSARERLADNLSAEKTERQQKDLAHDNSINTLTQAVEDEIIRATNAENTLSAKCDNYDSHIVDQTNPHGVTKAQIGLGNVLNVGQDSAPTNNSTNNVQSGGVFSALENKVDKVEGRGLSEQNFTYAEKTKLENLSNYDDTSLDARITDNETAINVLNGGSSVEGSVDKKILDAIADVTQIDFQIVTELPVSGVKGVIYFVQATGEETGNTYDEYVWLNSSWELLSRGTLSIDLSDYYTKAQTNALVSAKNNKITITDDSNGFTDQDTFLLCASETENPTAFTRKTITDLVSYIMLKEHPVGSLYISENNVNPATLFGGTWEQIKDRFLLSAGDTYTAGDTGGSATVTLAVGNLPSHTHSFTPSGSVSAHSHYYTPAGSVVANTITINKGTNNAGSGSNGGYYGDNMSNLTTVSVGSHSHTFSGTRKTTENATPTFTGTAGTTGGTGSGTAFSIMPPYLVVYVWKRTA